MTPDHQPPHPDHHKPKEIDSNIIPHILNEHSRLRKVLVNPTPKVVTTFTDLVVNPIQAVKLSKENYQKEVEELPGAAECHGNLLKILEDNGVELVYSDVTPIKPGHTPLFTRDVGVVIDNKVVPSRMRYEYRSVEVQGLMQKIDSSSIVKAEDEYQLEGGDIVFLEENFLLVGIGPRTNLQGLHLLMKTFPTKEFVAFSTVREEKAFHIDTNLGILGEKHLVYLPELVPIEIFRLLIDRGYTFVEASPDEYNTCCTNVIAIDDRRVIAPAENLMTNKRIADSGVEVISVPLKDILSFGGGPHCLTLPLVRE